MMDELSMQELEARREEIDARILELDTAAADRAFDETEKAEFDELKTELAAITDRIDAVTSEVEERRATLAAIAGRTTGATPAVEIRKSETTEKGGIASNVDGLSRLPESLHDLGAYRKFAGSVDELYERQREGAMRIAEKTRFVRTKHSGSESEIAEHIENTLEIDSKGDFAKRVIICGDPAYDAAFGKALMRGRSALTVDENIKFDAAITESGLGSETPVPITIDPTVLLTSNGNTNPLRAVADVRTISGLTWRGLTSAGITAAYESAETNQVADGSPTFGGTDINVLRVDAYAQFSMEVDMDWPQLRAELAREFADSKDVLEGTKFFIGSGTNEPTGLIVAVTAATAQIQKTATTAVFAYTDPKLAANALPVRWDSDAMWFGAKSVWSTLADLYAAAGNADPFSFAHNAAAAAQNVGAQGNAAGSYRGYPMNYASAMDTATTTSGKNIMILGDPDTYVIVDRIGMNVELIPMVFGANQRPTGQRGLYAYWRNNANVRTTAAWEVLQVK